MRIGELSRRSGVPVPTIKYYVREGLLPAGDRTKANQVEYAEAHLRRLGLVRALIEVGGISVRTAQRVLAHLDDQGTAPLSSMGKAQYALLGHDPGALPDRVPKAELDDEAAVGRRWVNELIERQGWSVGPNNPARGVLAEALAMVHRLGLDDVLARLDSYADAVAGVAEVDVELALGRPSLDEVAERVVVWTVLGDRVLSALRRLAQESAAAHRLAPPAAE